MSLRNLKSPNSNELYFGKVIITDTSSSTASSTASSSGSLLVSGGASIGGKLYVGGQILCGNVYDKTDIRYFGGVNDGVTNNKTALAAAITANGYNAITGDRSGQYYIDSTDNVTGLRFSRLNPNMQVSVGTDKKLYHSYAHEELMWGSEFLYSFYNKLMTKTAVKILFSGDSTTDGTYLNSTKYKINHIIENMSHKHKMSNVHCVNSGWLAKKTSDWKNTYLASDITEAPDVIVVRWGINDRRHDVSMATIDNNLRYCVNQLRTTLGTGCGIIMMTPNTCSSTYLNTVDEYWNEQMRSMYMAIAKDYKCAFIDTYALFQNCKDGANLWTDILYLHPLSNLQMQICSKVFDFLFPSYIIDFYSHSVNSITTTTHNVDSDVTLFVKGDKLDSTYSSIDDSQCLIYRTQKEFYPTIDTNKGILIKATQNISYVFDDPQNTGTISFDYTPSFSGAPATDFQLALMDHTTVLPVGRLSQILIIHEAATNKIRFRMRNSAGTTLLSIYSDVVSFVADTTYNICISWDYSTINKTNFFIDGVLSGTTSHNPSIVRDDKCNDISFGNYVSTADMHIKNVMIKNSYIGASFAVANMSETTLNNEQLTVNTIVTRKTITVQDTTQSTSSSTGSLLVAGGFGCAKNIMCNNIFTSSITHTFTFGGAVTSQNVYCIIQKCGNFCTLVFPTTEFTGNNTTDYIICSAGTVISTSGYVPTSSMMNPIVHNQMTTCAGRYRLQKNGYMLLEKICSDSYATYSNFNPTSGILQIIGFSVTYPI